MSFPRWALVAVAFVLAGCSGSTVPDALAAEQDGAATTAPAEQAVDDALPALSDAADPDEPDSDDAGSPDADSAVDSDAGSQSGASGEVSPIEAFDPNAEPPAAGEVDTSRAWISRRSMSASEIEVVWSTPEVSSEYHVHRLPRTSDIEPDSSLLTDANRIHVADEQGVFVDTGVTAGERYWYAIRGIDDGGAVQSVGWHLTAAVTDTQPPSAVEFDLEERDGAIFIEWDEPAENFELHSYRILRAVGDGEPEVVGATWTLDQRSFIDETPPQAVVTYSVVALDFHWNDSEPTEVTVDLS